VLANLFVIASSHCAYPYLRYISAVNDISDALDSASEVEFFLWYGFLKPKETEKIIVMSDDFHSSAEAARKLRRRGFKRARCFPGGIVGWRKNGGATVSS